MATVTATAGDKPGITLELRLTPYRGLYRLRALLLGITLLLLCQEYRWVAVETWGVKTVRPWRKPAWRDILTPAAAGGVWPRA